jgi:hypothetical protein
MENYLEMQDHLTCKDKAKQEVVVEEELIENKVKFF